MTNIRIILLLFLAACSTAQSLERLQRDHESIVAFLTSDPISDNKGRIFLYLAKDERRLVAVLRNKEEGYLIPQLLQDLLKHPKDQPLVIYADKVDEPIEEILSGIDYEVILIAYFVPQSSDYRYVQVNYSKNTREALREIEFRRIVPILLDSAKKLIH